MEEKNNNFTSPFENRPSVQEAKANAKKKAFVCLAGVIVAAIISLVIIISLISGSKDESAASAPVTTAVSKETTVIQEPEKTVVITEETTVTTIPAGETKEQKKAAEPLYYLTCECIEPPFLDGELIAAAKVSINPDSTNTKNIDIDFAILPGTKQEKHKVSRIGINWKDDEVLLMTPPVKADGKDDGVVAEVRIYEVKGQKPVVFKITKKSLIPFEKASSELQLAALSAADKNVSADPAKKQKMIECINSVNGIDKMLKQAMIDSLDEKSNTSENTTNTSAEAEGK